MPISMSCSLTFLAFSWSFIFRSTRYECAEDMKNISFTSPSCARESNVS